MTPPPSLLEQAARTLYEMDHSRPWHLLNAADRAPWYARADAILALPEIAARVGVPESLKREELMHENDLLQTMDGKTWAEEYVKRHGGDVDLMLAWFANAIMTGWDHAKRRESPTGSAAGEAGSGKNAPAYSEAEVDEIVRPLEAEIARLRADRDEFKAAWLRETRDLDARLAASEQEREKWEAAWKSADFLRGVAEAQLTTLSAREQTAREDIAKLVIQLTTLAARERGVREALELYLKTFTAYDTTEGDVAGVPRSTHKVILAALTAPDPTGEAK